MRKEIINQQNRSLKWLLPIACFILQTIYSSFTFLTAAEHKFDDNADVIVDYANIIGQSPHEYGSSTWWSDQHDSIWTARWKELNCSIIRVPISQSVIEPINDNSDPDVINWDGFHFDFPVPWTTITVTFDSMITALREAHVIIMPCTFYNVAWNSAHYDGLYSSYPAVNVKEYSEFVYVTMHHLVTELHFPPDSIMFEPINEPDLECDVDPNVHCFWDDWKMQDLIDLVHAAHQAVQAVDSTIKIIGLTECKGTSITEQFISSHDGFKYLDALSYHRYVNNDFTSAIDRGITLKLYGLPVYLNEYGNFQYYSNGTPGALWHSLFLTELWKNGISPVLHPLSDFPNTDEPYNQMALFWDWRNEWLQKPAYWVYANFYCHLGKTEIISTNTATNLQVIAGRKTDHQRKDVVTVWVINYDPLAEDSVSFQISNFPDTNAQLKVYNTLQGKTCVDSLDLSGNPLNFNYHIPDSGSFCFVITSRLSNAVPVEFIALSASGGANFVELNWSTATETNNYGFDVERAKGTTSSAPIAEKLAFQKISFVNGHGTTSIPQHYHFIDENLAAGFYYYRLKQIDTSGSYQYSKIVHATVERSKVPQLCHNYPNPFNSQTIIRYNVINRFRVTIKIYNLLGTEIRILLDEEKQPGESSVLWDGKNNDGKEVGSGIYIYEIRTKDFIQRKKMVYIR